MVDGPVPNAREFAALFDVSAPQLRLAEIAVLRAVDWCVRSPTACDYLHVFGERERGADCLPPHVIQQLREVLELMNHACSCLQPVTLREFTSLTQHSEQYCIRFMHSPDSCRFLPSEIAAAAWRESLSLWCVQGRVSDAAVALATRRSSRAPALAAAMAAAKVTRVPVCVKCSVWCVMPGQNAVVAELHVLAAASASSV
jgi:hypothetical protein